jgi:RNA polymerase primary sigma factor
MSLILQDKTEIPVSHGEDEAQQYLQQIRTIPRLTPGEELELAKLCAQGDREAVKKMVTANLRLVASVAKEYAGRGVPLLDLIQEGSIGLLTAAQKFDPSRETRFSTYATKWIRQGVSRAILNHAGLIRVPIHTAERIRKVLNAQKSLHQELEREPTLEEISKELDIPIEEVSQALDAVCAPVSLYDPVYSDGGDPLTVMDQVRDTKNTEDG